MNNKLTATFKRAVRNYQSVYSVATVDEEQMTEAKLPEMQENCVHGVCTLTWKPARNAAQQLIAAR